jgi:hypothetical protein
MLVAYRSKAAALEMRVSEVIGAAWCGGLSSDELGDLAVGILGLYGGHTIETFVPLSGTSLRSGKRSYFP